MRIVLDTNSLIHNARYIVTNDHHYDVLRTIDYPVVDIMALKDFAEILKQ